MNQGGFVYDCRGIIADAKGRMQGKTVKRKFVWGERAFTQRRRAGGDREEEDRCRQRAKQRMAEAAGRHQLAHSRPFPRPG